MTVSDLLGQFCNKPDNAIKVVTSCSQLVPNRPVAEGGGGGPGGGAVKLCPP